MIVPNYPSDLVGQLRIAVIREEISRRLWPVNTGMESVTYNALMDQMALAQFSGERRQAEEGLTMFRQLGLHGRPAT